VGRKSNHNRRENETYRDKELGIQTTLEEILKKDGKQGKSHEQSVKGSSQTLSQPSKGGGGGGAQQNTLLNKKLVSWNCRGLVARIRKKQWESCLEEKKFKSFLSIRQN
jgi:hypothetical protein